MYAQTTYDITISVKPVYLEDQSEPDEGRYLWAYHIRIENQGDETVQLLTRYWKITDANGRVQEVRGEGVVGEQPVIEPGDSYEYASGCPLDTPSGFMVGSYRLAREDGDEIDVAIPHFSLDSPHAATQIH
jgi:ApaG protein